MGLGGQTSASPRVVGRYTLYGSIASGGMATVHLGRLMGPVGFSRTVAIKRLHPQFAQDPEFVSMFLDEARLAARIRHPNVVPTLDVVATSGELFLVMEYVPGDSLARLARALKERRERVPLRIVSTIVCGLLHGLHAAHEAKTERGAPLGIVHRDVSPQNVLVGTDGVARVLDFGVAKAAGRTQETRDGQIKGKLSYMAPEQLRGEEVNRRCDIYAAGVVLWELITGERLFSADNEGALLAKVLAGRVALPSGYLIPLNGATISTESFGLYQRLDEVTLRALAPAAADRFDSAREMAIALERCVPPATPFEVGEWVESIASAVLSQRASLVSDIESSASMAAPTSASSATLSEGVSHVKEIERTRAGAAPIPPAAPSAGRPAPADLGQISQVSQLSSISVAGPPHRRAPPASHRTLAAILGVVAGSLLLVILVAGVLVIRKGPTPIAPAGTIDRATEPPTVVPIAPAPDFPTAATVAAPAANAASASPLDLVAPSPSASAATSSRAKAPATRPPRAPSVAPTNAAPQTTPTPPTDCVSWDKGIKHVNPKCL